MPESSAGGRTRIGVVMGPRAAPYVWTFAALFAAGIVRWGLDPWLAGDLPYFSFYFALLFAAWYGGFRTGILALVLGLVAGNLFFAVPRYTFTMDGVVQQLHALRFVTVGFCVSLICEALIRQTRRAETQSQSLRMTLASIGDAVITTDAQGRITYLNAVAESVTGWTCLEAVGLPLDSVFRIVNEESRKPVENPAMRALREGVVVGLANHTVLIRKDGAECPIDDSAAPIRDERGMVTGCVLIFRDISERRQTEKRIYGLMIELQEADRRKDEFLATLAHELRNPLAPLSNTLELLKSTETDADLLRRSLETMERQLGQLIRLVDDLLDVSRIARDKLQLRKERVELSTVITQAVESCRPHVERAHHALQVQLPPAPIPLEADRVRLAQVFGNLLNNSCKYTRPGGNIRITAARHEGEVVVTVQDTGTGIPPEELGGVFDMFTQVDRTLERSHGGLGIGLTLVKRLVEMHGGSVEARSEGENKGSEFVVRLPVCREQPRLLSSPANAVRRVPQNRRILVVDDNRDSATSLAMLLKVVGNTTHVAHDGVEALAAAESLHPEVVLLDIGLPRLNGLDVCRRIREQPWGRNMVLIALTGWGQEDDRRKSQEAGFHGHFVKPVDHVALMKFITTLSPLSTSDDCGTNGEFQD